MLILLAGLVVAAGSSVFVASSIAAQLDARLEERADRVTDVIDLQLRQYEAISRAVAAVRPDATSQAEYDTRIAALGLTFGLPGSYALNSTTLLQPAEVPAYEARERASGSAGFAVYPEPTANEELLVIDRVAPFAQNAGALGFDIRKNPDAAVAADRAVRTGTPSLSDALTLVQEPGEQTALVLYMPWYANDGSLGGVTSLVLRGQDFLEALDLGGVGVTITDPTSSEGVRQVAAVDPTPRDPGGLMTARTMELYGQTWQVDVSAFAGFASGAERSAPAVILLAIIALAGLAASLTAAITRREEHARRQVHERTRELVGVNGRLHDALAAKDEFLAVLGHEFRTPLTVIRGFATTVKAGRVGPVSDEVATMLERIEWQASRLDGLVDDLLIAARLQQKRVRVRHELVDIGEILRGVAAEHIERLGTINVHAPEGLIAEVDRTHCARLFSALLSNTAKYGAAPVTLTAWQEGVEAVIRVQDSGPGIDPSIRESVFVAFSQADSGSRRRSQGVGLGLAIVRELCVQNGGSVELCPESEQGACFVLRLPLAGQGPSVGSDSPVLDDAL